MFKSTLALITALTLAVVATTTLASCPSLSYSPGQVVVADIKSTTRNIVEVHDSYLINVETDAAITYRAESEALLDLVESFVEIPAASFSFTADSVMARHDLWVTADLELTALERRVYLRNTEVIRKYVETVTTE
jgi:hypothetical protein